jgi:hypothetical protein
MGTIITGRILEDQFSLKNRLKTSEATPDPSKAINGKQISQKKIHLKFP